MQLVDQKFANPDLICHCLRCGDTYDCATEDDCSPASLHQLLHLAGDWRRSLWPPAAWAADRDSASPPS